MKLSRCMRRSKLRVVDDDARDAAEAALPSKTVLLRLPALGAAARKAAAGAEVATQIVNTAACCEAAHHKVVAQVRFPRCCLLLVHERINDDGEHDVLQQHRVYDDERKEREPSHQLDVRAQIEREKLRLDRVERAKVAEEPTGEGKEGEWERREAFDAAAEE